MDIHHFAFDKEYPNHPVFLFVGRLLQAKGLCELYEAAKLVKREHPEAEFRILGPAENGPGTVSLDTVLAWQEEGVIFMLPGICSPVFAADAPAVVDMRVKPEGCAELVVRHRPEPAHVRQGSRAGVAGLSCPGNCACIPSPRREPERPSACRSRTRPACRPS